MPNLQDRFEQVSIDLGQAIADAYQRLQKSGSDALDDIKENADEFRGAIERIWSAALAHPDVPAQEVLDEGTSSGASEVSDPSRPVVDSPGADETEDYKAHNAAESEAPQDDVDERDADDEQAELDSTDADGKDPREQATRGDQRSPAEQAESKVGGEPTTQTGDGEGVTREADQNEL